MTVTMGLRVIYIRYSFHAAEIVNKAHILAPFVNQKFRSTYINGGGDYSVRNMDK
jgi:hypothetical protein